MEKLIDLIRQREEDKTQEILAKTYLPISNTERAKPPEEAKFSHHGSTKKLKIGAIAMLSASMLLLAISIFLAFSTHAFSVNIVVNKKAPLMHENLLFTQKLSFTGSSSNLSHLSGGYLVLSDSGSLRHSGVAIDLNKNIDLSHRLLLLTAMTKNGKGKMDIIFRDKNLRSYTTHLELPEEGKELWQNFIISSFNFKNSIDVGNIRHIRLEFNKDGLQSQKGTTVHIKTVALIDN